MPPSCGSDAVAITFGQKNATSGAARHTAGIVELGIGTLVVLVALGAANKHYHIHSVSLEVDLWMFAVFGPIVFSLNVIAGGPHALSGKIRLDNRPSCVEWRCS